MGSSFCTLAQGGRNGNFPASTVNGGAEAADTLSKDSVATAAQPDTTAAAPAGQAVPDTAAQPVDSLAMDSIAREGAIPAVADSLRADTLAEDTGKVSKSVLDSPVEYTAADSVTFEAGMGNANLYGESKVNYTNLELQADWITMNLDSSIVHAVGRADSTGKVKNQPVFKQGGDQYEPDRISYNFKTRKAFIDNVYTAQGEGFLISEQSKRDSEGVMYLRRGKYTTCNAKHPHFYMALTRAKVRPGKDVVFGPAYLVVEDVPLPLAIPYGFFPFSKKYSSGFIMPTFGDESIRGFYLRDGGYYLSLIHI